MIAPDIAQWFAVLKWADGLAPMIDVLDAVAMSHTTARKTHETGMQSA